PLDRDQSPRDGARLRLRPGTEQFRELPCVRLAHFGHPPEELRIGFGEVPDRVAGAQGQSGPIGKSAFREFVIGRLEKRTRGTVRVIREVAEPAEQAERHVRTFQAPALPRRQLVIADFGPNRREFLEGGTWPSLEDAREGLSKALETLAETQGRCRAEVSESVGAHFLEDLVSPLEQAPFRPR